MSAPVKVEYHPDGDIPASIQLLALGRAKVPKTRPIEAGSIAINQLGENIRFDKVKFLEQGVDFSNVFASLL